MLSTRQIMSMTGQKKWMVIASLRDKRYTRELESVQAWIDAGKPIRELKYHNLPFKTLLVGESFDTDSNISYVRNRASHYSRRLNMKLKVSKINDTTTKVTRTA